MKGLIVNIYKSSSDSTNGGGSATHDRAIIIGPGIPKIFEPQDGDFVLELVQRVDGTYFAKPRGETRWTMFGGNFAWTSDSRFRRLSEAPVQIHDRVESY